MITIKLKTRSKRIIFIVLCLFLIISGNVYASNEIYSELKISEEFIEWQNLPEEERNKSIMPSMYSVEMPKEILEEQTQKIKFSEIIRSHTNSIIQYPVASNASLDYYNLNDKLDIEVRDQGIMQCCWGVAVLNSMELNEQLRTGEATDYSERHMDFATSESFYDGTNNEAFKRDVKEGGTALIGLAYLTNGQGAIQETAMPFKNSLEPIALSEVDIEPIKYVTEYVTLPTIYKKNINGNIINCSASGVQYTDEEVKVIRDNIKQHIVDNGGVVAYTAAGSYDYYSDSNTALSEAYYCDNDNISYDHAVTIVGWDDNYSKENFTGKAKPTEDGAYIVLNSYSDEVFNDGYIYISYQDVWIETALYGITNTSDVNYDNLYQHDFYGGPIQITLYDAYGNVPEKLYFASIFDRDINNKEKLTYVSVNNDKYCKYEIFVNTNGTDLNVNNLVKVATTETLEPGYHQIDIEDIELTGKEFAVVVKETSMDGNATLLIEPQMSNTFYEYAGSENGDSKISIDGSYWQDLSDIGNLNYAGNIIDTSESDVCIKAFTEIIDEEDDEKPDDEKPDDEKPEDEKPEDEKTEDEKPEDEQPEDEKPDDEKPDDEKPDDEKPDDEKPEDEEPEDEKPEDEQPEDEKPKDVITSDKYTITDDLYITKIEVGETILDVFNGINFTNMYKIYNKDNNEIKDYKIKVKTGMYIETNNVRYSLVVRTDVNGDGKISLIDLSRALAHIHETEGYKLEGAYLLACDLDLDGNVTLKDFSQFLALYNNL